MDLESALLERLLVGVAEGEGEGELDMATVTTILILMMTMMIEVRAGLLEVNGGGYSSSACFIRSLTKTM